VGQVADRSWAFWSAPIGSAVVSFAVGFPADCRRPGDFVGHVGRQGLDEQCDNVLGFTAVMPSEVGAAVGAVFYGIASFIEDRNQSE
jgi:hypothetical protein